MNKAKAVLDASALFALLHQERGAEKIEEYLRKGGIFISAVNYGEVISKLAEKGVDIEAFRLAFPELGIEIVELDEAIAFEAGRLRLETKALGFSLGDRVCLALGRHLSVPVLTTDGAWEELNKNQPIVVIR